MQVYIMQISEYTSKSNAHTYSSRLRSLYYQNTNELRFDEPVSSCPQIKEFASGTCYVTNFDNTVNVRGSKYVQCSFFSVCNLRYVLFIKGFAILCVYERLTESKCSCAFRNVSEQLLRRRIYHEPMHDKHQIRSQAKENILNFGLCNFII